MSLRDLVDGEAMRDDDENDADVAEHYEGDEGEVREGAGTVNHYNDSSEEDEEEDDDEEAARAVSWSSNPRKDPCALTINSCDRFVKVSSSTRMKRSKTAAVTTGASDHALGKRNISTRMIWS